MSFPLFDGSGQFLELTGHSSRVYHFWSVTCSHFTLSIPTFSLPLQYAIIMKLAINFIISESLHWRPRAWHSIITGHLLQKKWHNSVDRDTRGLDIVIVLLRCNKWSWSKKYRQWAGVLNNFNLRVIWRHVDRRFYIKRGMLLGIV